MIFENFLKLVFQLSKLCMLSQVEKSATSVRFIRGSKREIYEQPHVVGLWTTPLLQVPVYCLFWPQGETVPLQVPGHEVLLMWGKFMNTPCCRCRCTACSDPKERHFLYRFQAMRCSSCEGNLWTPPCCRCRCTAFSDPKERHFLYRFQAISCCFCEGNLWTPPCCRCRCTACSDFKERQFLSRFQAMRCSSSEGNLWTPPCCRCRCTACSDPKERQFLAKFEAMRCSSCDGPVLGKVPNKCTFSSVIFFNHFAGKPCKVNFLSFFQYWAPGSGSISQRYRSGSGSESFPFLINVLSELK